MIQNFIARATIALMSRKGVSAAEYAILAVGIVILVGTAVGLFSSSFTAIFTKIGTEIAKN